MSTVVNTPMVQEGVKNDILSSVFVEKEKAMHNDKMLEIILDIQKDVKEIDKL